VTLCAERASYLARQSMRPRAFLCLLIFLIVLSRSAVILTSNDNEQIDLSIYQETGQLVVNGIDPYNFVKDHSKRNSLRMDGHGTGDWGKANEAAYDYYVSSNLPGSTAFYGLVEWATRGNLELWRLVLSLGGDIAVALAAYFFMRSCGIEFDLAPQQRLFALVLIFYPSVIYWGLIRAEDKQFETALLLLTAGLLTGNRALPRVIAFSIGLAFSMSVFFKAFGIFLTPLLLAYLRRRSWQEIAFATLGAAMIAVPLLVFFDQAFLLLIFDRFVVATVGASGAVLHASPWQLFPSAAFHLGRPIVCALLIGVVWVGYQKRLNRPIECLRGKHGDCRLRCYRQRQY